MGLALIVNGIFMNKLIFSSLALFVSSALFAEGQQQISERLDDSRRQSETFSSYTQPQTLKTPITQVAEESQTTVRMSAEELQHYPDLTMRALASSLSSGNVDGLAVVYPVYQKLPAEYQHPLMSKWAEALLAKKEQDYRQSIRLFRELLAEQAGNSPARLQLATVLFSNNELEAAEDQFKKLRSEPLPPQIYTLIDEYLEAIAHKDRWTFSGGLTYLNDPNINNAPKAGTTYGNWTAPEKESAEGVGFNMVLGKKWSWGNGFYNEFRLNTNGRYYWNNRKYSEVTGRGSVGFGFQNAKTNVELLPFMEQTLYAGGSRQSDSLKRFSKAGGVGLEMQHWLSDKWQISSSYEFAEQRYTSRKHLNGNYHYVGLGGLYLVNAKQYWFANLNYTRMSTRDADDSYFRRGLTLGWQQEWNWGLSTRLSASLAEKRYKAEMPIFQITQRNKEYGVQASIWHRAVHYWGITPRLTYSLTKTKSNHAFYSYDKHRVFVDFSKSF